MVLLPSGANSSPSAFTATWRTKAAFVRLVENRSSPSVRCRSRVPPSMDRLRVRGRRLDSPNPRFDWTTPAPLSQRYTLDEGCVSSRLRTVRPARTFARVSRRSDRRLGLMGPTRTSHDPRARTANHGSSSVPRRPRLVLPASSSLSRRSREVTNQHRSNFHRLLLVSGSRRAFSTADASATCHPIPRNAYTY